ncbi:MAG TPA: acetyl-CoA C-acyltransferase [Thermoplasmata archaeon]|nr:acetyl-CoA C-acyltransferase [Thermoplasmata archaeon]
MSEPSVRVAIVGAARTPLGKHGGALRNTPAVALGAVATVEALRRARVAPREVPELVFGHCIQAGAGQNSARQVLRRSGLRDTAGGVTVNKVCGSGMKALLFATAEIRSGEFPLAVAGGMESMSQAPFLLPSKFRWGQRYGDVVAEDAMLKDALLDAYGEHEHMGATGERIARRFHLTREEVDRFALRSHQRASEARDSGLFDAEIAPVPPDQTPGAEGLARDEGPRGDTSLEKLGRLRPAFSAKGLLTAGNSSQLSDGAAALVIMSEAEATRRGVDPLAWVHSGVVSGVSPPRVMESPIPAVRAHLKRSGFSAKDFDRVEHNEAFASASIAVQRALGFSEAQFNVHGGAVALGHPIGASGARIVVTLLYEMMRAKSRLGLATLCMGGGNGLSLILDRRELT